MTSRRRRAEGLLEKGMYLDALQSYVQEPLQHGPEYDQFLVLLHCCLDHVFETSPAPLLPKLLELLYPLFRDDETVMLLLGIRCLDEEMYSEAEFLLQTIQNNINADCLISKEGLRKMHEVIVPRWHFPMLNDVIRNSSYSHAIFNIVGHIPDCSVLDIGSGTGLLSMLAVRAGAARVYACEMNATMVTMSRDVISANEMADKIKVIHKMSTDCDVPDDILKRVCLVVTETVDAGLLGEAIVPTLRHAWSQLLLPNQPTGSTNQIAQCGHVIPCGATVYVMAIECPEIAKQSRLLFEVVGGLNYHGIKLEGSSKGLIQDSGVQERESARDKCGWEKRERRRKQSGVVEGLDREPYTCERLSTIRGGYRQLSSTFAALSIDFTNPLIPLPSADVCAPVLSSGNLDAIAMYFDLHLDATTTVSTSPFNNETSAWEQAIYPIATSRGVGGERVVNGLLVERGDSIHLHIVCSDTLVHVNVDKIERPSSDTGATTQCPISESAGQFVDSGAGTVSGSTVHFIDRGAMCRLNDKRYYAVYSSAISHSLKHFQTEDLTSSNNDSNSESHSNSTGSDSNVIGMESEHHSNYGTGMESENETSTDDEDIAECIVLDMSHELPLLGLMAAKLGANFVQVGRCHSFYEALLDEVTKVNNLQQNTSIKWVELELTSVPRLMWDIVLCDVVSSQGILRPNVFEELGKIRDHCTHSDTVFLPGKITVHSVAITSTVLRAQTMVLGSVPTLGLDIARFINKYQISHYIDIDVNSLVHDKLTEDTELMSIDLNTLSNTPFMQESKVCVKVVSEGILTGFIYWFTLHFPNGETISTLQTEGHWHQAIFCLSEDVSLHCGQYITLRTLIKDSLIDITLVNIH